MYDTCMPTRHIPVIYSIVSQKMADLGQIYKNSGTQNQFAQITIHRYRIGIKMAYRYKPESVETKMAGVPYMCEPAPNRG